MRIRDSLARLLAELSRSGLEPGPVSSAAPTVVLDVARRLSAERVVDAEPVEQDGDGLLAQFGTYGFGGPREFLVDLTRQFAKRSRRQPQLWQLRCTLSWQPTPETDALGRGQLWSFGLEPETFFARAAELPGWAWALRGPDAPARLQVRLDAV